MFDWHRLGFSTGWLQLRDFLPWFLCPGGGGHTDSSCSSRAQGKCGVFSFSHFVPVKGMQKQRDPELQRIAVGIRISCPECHLYKSSTFSYLSRSRQNSEPLNPDGANQFSKGCSSLSALCCVLKVPLSAPGLCHLTCSVIPTCLLLPVEGRLR